jgi:tetratricopeptide (TPR) repeat protein
VDDLILGADLTWIDDRTVAVVPRQTEAAPDRDGNKPSARRLHLIFGTDGRLAERRLVETPSGKTVLRETYENGVVTRRNADDKVVSVRRLTVRAGQPPLRKPHDKDFVVLPMPPRTKEHIRNSHEVPADKEYSELDTTVLLELASTEVALQDGSKAVEALRKRIPESSIRQLALMALAVRPGWNVRNILNWRDVLVLFPRDPLATYLTHFNDTDADRWTSPSEARRDGQSFWQLLEEFRVLRHRLTSKPAGKKATVPQDEDRTRALQFVRRHPGSPLAWELLCILDNEGGGSGALRPAIGEAYRLFEDVPGLGYEVKYERARRLLKMGRAAEAAVLFKDLYTRTLDAGMLPPIDQSFRQALRGDTKGADQWPAWMQRTAARLVVAKRRPAVTVLAWQSWELGDKTLADRLLTAALDRAADDGEYMPAALAGIEYLIQTAQNARADQLLQSLLARKSLATNAALWRLGAMIATQQGLPSRQRAYLERMVELEFRRLPDDMDWDAVRHDLGLLMGHYQQMAKAMSTLETKPPADFLVKVVRAADFWRSLDPEDGNISVTAAWICETLGDHELAWEYLTTALARQLPDARSLSDLAVGFQAAGARNLADRAYEVDFEADPTNPLSLWLRAENLQQMGQHETARRLLQQIVDGVWPGWESIQRQAREQVEGR